MISVNYLLKIYFFVRIDIFLLLGIFFYFCGIGFFWRILKFNGDFCCINFVDILEFFVKYCMR